MLVIVTLGGGYVRKKLNIWKVFFNTTDYPEQYVARRFELDKPTEDHLVDASIGRVRSWIAEEATRYGQGVPVRTDRNPQDAPVIVEVWF